MDTKRIEERARALAEKAKDGNMRIGNALYLLTFDDNEWVYRVYCESLLLVSFNTKSLATAKRYLKEYLS